MKSLSAFIIIIGLAGVLVVIAAFINLYYEKTIKHLQSTENNKGFAIVELFTSEGCSSCLPAEELIEKIQKDNRNKQIYILAYHVDYWDHQGWKDKFSDREFSDRQRRYAGWLNLQTLYTPQFVINGVTEYIGSDQNPILRTISNGLNQERTKTLTLNCRIEDGRVNVEYQGTGNEKESELVLALIQKSGQSNVRAGENSGRSLSHVQIVRQLLYVDINRKENAIMYLPHDFNKKGWELIGFVQHKTNGRIMSAARFDFESGFVFSK